MGSAAAWLPVQALSADGLLVRDDGALVRYLRVVPGNPLVLDGEGCERMTRGFTEMLLRIPAGRAVTYEDIARDIGAPTAMRAVGAAIGQNPVAFLIPCHRVLRKSGVFGEYHWGATRKKAILGWESSRAYAEAI